MTSPDPQRPWFSGFCLQGELAGQYELGLGKSSSGADGVCSGQANGNARQLLELDGLGPITIFVGANNSGKSRLMRGLFGDADFVTHLRLRVDPFESGPGLSDLQGLAKQCLCWEDILIDTLMPYRKDLEESLRAGDWIGIDLIPFLDFIRGELVKFVAVSGEKLKSSTQSFQQEEERVDRYKHVSIQYDAARKWLEHYESLRQSNQLICRMAEFFSLRRCYVPMLRGMRPPSFVERKNDQAENPADSYEQRTVRDYFHALENWKPPVKSKKLFGFEINHADEDDEQRRFHSDPRIFTGLGLFDDLQKRLLAPMKTERESVRVYEEFLSEYFFSGQEVTLTPAMETDSGEENDVVHIKIGEKEDRPIHELGDGMQGLIICTYPIIMELQKGGFFFFEEPDLGMHPSLQRIFIEVLKKYHHDMGHQFFLTTHSNHFLDVLEDTELVSIFSFSEIEAPPSNTKPAGSLSSQDEHLLLPSFRIRPSEARDRQVLTQLGVRPSSTYLANASIWVEGVSDCAYLRAYMAAFLCYLDSRGGQWGKPLAAQLGKCKEDRHYAFVEYNGSNLPHFSFVDESLDAAERQDNTSLEAAISVPNLCAHAIVLADRDIETKGGGERERLFVGQLESRFVKLPGKEIENLIPPELLKKQIEYDHAPPRQPKGGSVSDDTMGKINYIHYARSETGMGGYLDGIDIKTYRPSASSRNGSVSNPGTLPSYYKARWRSDSEGIPFRVKESMQCYLGRLQQGSECEDELRLLPEFITQDIVWLCVVLFAHIAQANHDHGTAGRLREFRDWIVQYSAEAQPAQETAASAGSSLVNQPAPDRKFPPEWPLHLQRDPLLNKDNSPQFVPSYRECLLKRFL